MNLTEAQLKSISKYLADISKLVFATTVLGFFIQTNTKPISVFMLVVGATITVFTFYFSVKIIPNKNT